MSNLIFVNVVIYDLVGITISDKEFKEFKKEGFSDGMLEQISSRIRDEYPNIEHWEINEKNPYETWVRGS